MITDGYNFLSLVPLAPGPSSDCARKIKIKSTNSTGSLLENPHGSRDSQDRARTLRLDTHSVCQAELPLPLQATSLFAP